MLEIKNVEVHGLDRAIKASGNAMTVGEINTLSELTEKDGARASTLGRVDLGTGHDGYLKGITVTMDIKYSQYWSIEAQRYHWFNIVTSQSKMHRLTLAGKDFNEFQKKFNEYVDTSIITVVHHYIKCYNDVLEDDKITAKDKKDKLYFYYMKALSNLPMGYELWMTVTTNYLQLKTMYVQRKNHKLKEDWGAFIDMCNKLPLFKLLTNSF